MAPSILTWNTGAKLVGELGYQVVIDAILQRAQNDHRTSVIYRKALHRLIRQDILVGRCKIQPRPRRGLKVSTRRSKYPTHIILFHITQRVISTNQLLFW